jgi:hypothetical protein
MKLLLVVLSLVFLVAWSVMAFLIYFIAGIDIPPEELQPFSIVDHFIILFPFCLFAFYIYSAISRLNGIALIISGITIHALEAIVIYTILSASILISTFPGENAIGQLYWTICGVAAVLVLGALWFFVVASRFQPEAEQGAAANP